MKKNLQRNPKLVSIHDRHGEELLAAKTRELVQKDRVLLRPTTVREDLQAVRRRPLDAPMATRERPYPNTQYQLDDVVPKLGVGRLVLAMLLMATSFIAGVAVGRLT